MCAVVRGCVCSALKLPPLVPIRVPIYGVRENGPDKSASFHVCVAVFSSRKTKFSRFPGPDGPNNSASLGASLDSTCPVPTRQVFFLNICSLARAKTVLSGLIYIFFWRLSVTFECISFVQYLNEINAYLHGRIVRKGVDKSFTQCDALLKRAHAAVRSKVTLSRDHQLVSRVRTGVG